MMSAKKREKYKISIWAAILIGFALLLIIVGVMNVKNAAEQRRILVESIKSQLTSTAIAAREMIDVNALVAYNAPSDVEADAANYDRTLKQLRTLAQSVGAKYIYVLKYVGDDCYFVFDTDETSETIFEPYELSQVHNVAFSGMSDVGIMNVVDEYGSFNTAAVPIFNKDNVVGIICVDVEDSYMKQSARTMRVNTTLLMGTLLITMALVLFVVSLLMKRVRSMQNRLESMAHFDAVTGLPNRQFLIEQLSQMTRSKDTPFALAFIDLDNFKKVNDNAGHDAGDELLLNIAQFLRSVSGEAKAFRPAPGQLNIAARIGGDEFVLILSNVKNAEEAEKFADGLLRDFDITIRRQNRFAEKYDVGFSVGVALFPYHTENYHVLIKYADIAMYQAKRAGKNSYCIYHDDLAAMDGK